MRSVLAATAAILVAGAASAEPVPVQWTIETKGTGPGVVDATVTTKVELTDMGHCSLCTGQYGDCVREAGSFQAVVSGLVNVPEGQTNIKVEFSGGGSFLSSGYWGWMMAANQYINGGGPLASGTSPSGSFEARIPHDGFFIIGVGMGWINGGGIWACAPSVGCGMTGLCGKGSDSWSMKITYSTKAENAPKTCTQDGVAMLEPDAVWRPIASAGCMTAPDVAQSWTGNASTEAPVTLQSRMVADANYPDGPAGPVLIARAGCVADSAQTAMAKAMDLKTTMASSPASGEMYPANGTTITGYVAGKGEDDSTIPIAGALVRATSSGQSRTVATASDGTFRLDLWEGVFRVEASSGGYRVHEEELELQNAAVCLLPMEIVLQREEYAMALSAFPKALLPSGWQAHGKAPQVAEVKVKVTRGGEPVEGVGVLFHATATANPGHLHNEGEATVPTMRVGSIVGKCITDEAGVCVVPYTAAEAAAEVRIDAHLDGEESVRDELKLAVGVSLGSITGAGKGFVFKSPDPMHGMNRGATGPLAEAAVRIGELYAEEVKRYVGTLPAGEAALIAVTLRYTDASLERGGLYDFANHNWSPPHNSHRYGRDLDIAKRGINADGAEFVGGQAVQVCARRTKLNTENGPI